MPTRISEVRARKHKTGPVTWSNRLPRSSLQLYYFHGLLALRTWEGTHKKARISTRSRLHTLFFCHLAKIYELSKGPSPLLFIGENGEKKAAERDRLPLNQGARASERYSSFFEVESGCKKKRESDYHRYSRVQQSGGYTRKPGKLAREHPSGICYVLAF